MRWLHISDAHFHSNEIDSTPIQLSEQTTWRSLLDHIEERTRTGLGPEFILFSGDLTWDGTEEAFENARTKVAELLKAARLDPESLFIVPGNHDVQQDAKSFKPAMDEALHATYSRIHRKTDLTKQRQAAYLQASLTLNPDRQIVCPMLREYSLFASAVMEQVNSASDSVLTWDTVVGPQNEIALVGMNTAWVSFKSEIEEDAALTCGANLVVEALTRAMQHHPAPKLCLLLGHHPSESLYDFKEIVGKAEGLKVPLVYLRGHLHRPTFRLNQDGHGAFVEVSAGAVHTDLFATNRPPHRITWGFFDGSVVEFESRIQHKDLASKWVLDTSAFPTREHDNYRLRVELNAHELRIAIPRAAPAAAKQFDFIGVGLSSVSTIASLASDPSDHADRKADTRALWEPELGTFAPFVGSVLSRFGRHVGLVTSIGDDVLGRSLRQLLVQQGIDLLFCASVLETGRQISLTPRGGNSRWNIDRQIDRQPLTRREERTLDGVLQEIIGARWLAFDKYELHLMERIFASETWRNADVRPFVMFETGSRPLKDTRATSDGARARELIELSTIFIQNVDIFTTTREWVISASGGSVESEALDWAGVTTLLHLESRNPRPKALVVTLGSDGTRVVTRGSAATVRISTDVAEDTVDRRGAGDVLRAAMIEALLQERDRGKVEEALVSLESLSALTHLAQDIVRRWLTRDETADYFSNFTEKARRVLRGLD